MAAAASWLTIPGCARSAACVPKRWGNAGQSAECWSGGWGYSAEFERAMIRDRVLAGLDRARSSGKRLGKPRTTPFQVQRIRLALDEGRGVRETARLLKISAAKVSEVRRMTAAMIDLHP